MLRPLAREIERFADRNPLSNVFSWFWCIGSLTLGLMSLYLYAKGSSNHYWISFLIPAAMLFPPLRFPWWSRFLAIVGQMLTT